jgi:organic hydroperoxide reductase OsmC/OhrA
MAVTARRPGIRPETIRTRLARFMPRGADEQPWTVIWAAHTERRDELSGSEELRAADHLGCYGSDLAHAMAQEGLAPRRTRLSATWDPGKYNEAPSITIEVRCVLPGIDQAVFEAVVREVEPGCPVWNSLAGEVAVKVEAVLDVEPAPAPAPAAVVAVTDEPAPGSVQTPALGATRDEAPKEQPSMPTPAARATRQPSFFERWFPTIRALAMRLGNQP